MNWRLQNACSLIVRGSDNESETVVKVSLNADVLDRFCIGLCLLKEDLIDRLYLADTSGSNALQLERSAHATSIELRRDRINLAVGATELDRWLHFTLRAVRDGVAEVDHLDLEATETNQKRQRIDLVIAYPCSAPPVSSSEARRRLGL